MITGFIGCGNMASAIISGMLSSGWNAESIAVFDRHSEKVEKFCSSGVIQAKSIKQINEISDIIVLCVKPDGMNNVLDEIEITKDKLFVTIAAGLTLSYYYGRIGKKIVRVMPNTPATVLCAVSAVCPGEAVTAEDLKQVCDITDSFGETFVMPECKINAEIAIGGSSPAYVFMLIDALASAGVQQGLKRKDAQRIAAMSVMGSAKMLLESDKHPCELRDMVCSPGGTTIDAVASLEESGFGDAIMKAVKICKEKADKMS